MFHKLVFRKRSRKKCIWKRICQIHQIRWIKYKYKYKYMVWNLIKYKYKYKYAVFVFVFANTNTYLTPALPPGVHLNIKTASYQYRNSNPIIQIRWSHDRLIFIMEIPIPGKTICILRPQSGNRKPLRWSHPTSVFTWGLNKRAAIC